MSEENVEESNKRLTDLLAKMVDYMDRDYEMRKGHLANNKEQLKHNKWKTRAFVIIFGFPLLFYVLIITDFIKAKAFVDDYVAQVRVEGVISAGKPASAKLLVPAIKKAFEDEAAKGVVLLINSPGGSPAQSDIIHNTIKRYREKYPDKKVVAVAEDVAASGAYWIATSSDQIYVNNNTVIGSIGVITEGFGFDVTAWAKKYGLERRVFTSGKNKSRNDMFLPLKQKDIEKSKTIMDQVHKNFIAKVLSTRKGKIKIPDDKAFSGDYWLGEEAVSIGIADEVMDLGEVLEKEFSVSTVVDYTKPPTFYDNMSKAFTSSIPNLLFNALSIRQDYSIKAM